MAKDCVQEILASLTPEEGRLLKKDIESIVSRMSKEKALAFTDGVLNPDSQFRERAMKILERERTAIKVEKLKTLENIEKRQIANLKLKERQTPASGMSALMVGDHKLIGENRDSIAGRQHALQESLQAVAIKEVESTGLSKVIQSGALDREIRIEISELNKGENGNPGISNSKEAMVAAKAIQKVQKTILGTLNASGAYIRELEGWAGKVTHDQAKIAKINKQEWIDRISPLLDHEKTFRSGLLEQDPQEFLSRVYDDIVSGKSSRQQEIEASSDKLYRIIDSPPNFAKRAEKSRTLHFQDAAAEFDYLKQFGSDKTLYEQTISQARKAGKDAGMMQVLGTNPGATFEVLIKSNKIEDKLSLNSVRNQFKEISGETLQPGASVIAQVGSGLRAVQALSKLGFSVVNSIGDLGTRSHQLQNSIGDGYFSAWNKTAQSTFDAISNPQARREVTYLTGVAADAYAGALHSNLAASDPVPGAITRIMNMYYKANLQAPWTNINKQAQAMVLSADVGMKVGRRFNELDEAAVRNFKRFGITDKEWGFIRAGAEVAEDGRSYVGFQNIFDMDSAKAIQISKEAGLIPAGATEAQAKRIAERAKFDAATKMSVYYNDQVSTAMLEPTARERSLLLQGTHQDSVVGQALRLFAQFKMFPTSMITQVTQSTLYANGATNLGEAFIGQNANKMGMAKLMVDLTVLSYGSIALASMLKNKTPPDPTKSDTITEAMKRAGVGGLYADFLVGEFDSRYGRGALSALMGPTLGQIDDVFNLKTDIQKYARGEKRNFPATAAGRLVANNFPGANLFYAKAAIDHYILYNFSEKMNPGYMARMEARMKKKGQKTLIQGGQ